MRTSAVLQLRNMYKQRKKLLKQKLKALERV